MARAASLDPRSGETGANAVVAINTLLGPIVRPLLGHDRYAGDHATSLGAVLTALRADLADSESLALFDHGVPVMVQTMTRSMPGWNGWNATHMITIVGADLTTGNADVDTVTYAETPSTVAAYGGPPFQTITLHRLWVAMQQYNTDSPSDPVNLIH
ncbi:MAG TPA: hypothetical protein VIY28_07770 [Pseudonocardiaceae bacterium]